MLFAQERLLRAAGIRSDRKARVILAAVGVREFVATGTILAMRHRRVGAWSRVGGDTIDLALLTAAFRTRREHTMRLLGAIAFIATIFGTDLITAIRLNRAEGVGVSDGSGSQGTGVGHKSDGSSAAVRTAVTILAPQDQVRAAFKAFPWSAFDPSSLEASRQARFVPAPHDRGTELHLRYDPGARGRLALSALKLTGRSPDQKINDQLRHFKALIETGVEVRSDKTPEGFSSARQIFQRPGKPRARESASPSERQPGEPAAGRF
jgi:hypothetical protein